MASGQPQLAANSRLNLVDGGENLGRKNIASRHRQTTRRSFHRRLFHDVGDGKVIVGLISRCDDPVLVGLFARHFPYGNGGGRTPLDMRLDHSADHTSHPRRGDDRVAEPHHERLVADEFPRLAHGIGIAGRSPLPHIVEFNALGLRSRTRRSRYRPSAPPTRDRRRSDPQLSASCGPLQREICLIPALDHLLDHVLHDGLATNGQHLLRLGLGRRQ